MDPGQPPTPRRKPPRPLRRSIHYLSSPILVPPVRGEVGPLVPPRPPGCTLAGGQGGPGIMRPGVKEDPGVGGVKEAEDDHVSRWVEQAVRLVWGKENKID